MAYDERLAGRLRDIYDTLPNVKEQKAFGGITFLVNGHMSCGIVKDTLMARVGPEQYEAALKRKFAREMDFTGRPMKGFVFVAPEGIKTKKVLRSWVDLTLNFVSTLKPK